MITRQIIALIIIITTTSNIPSQKYGNIQVFDLEKAKVTKTVQSNSKIQYEIENCLAGITGIYMKLNPIPQKGYMAKIPLEPYVKVQNKFFVGFVKEIIIVFPEQQKPYFLVFDDENKMHVLLFEGRMDTLLKKVIKKETA